MAAKNTDTREHDIADSDDYFQYHGGMVATVRALTGKAPAAYVGDSTRPEAVRTRTLHEETSRVFRARVVNPRWIGAPCADVGEQIAYGPLGFDAARVDIALGIDGHFRTLVALLQESEPARPAIAEIIRQRCHREFVRVCSSARPELADPRVGSRAEEVKVPRTLTSQRRRNPFFNSTFAKQTRELSFQLLTCRFLF